MDSVPKFEKYPLWIIAIANTVSISVYLFGTYIMCQLGIFYGVLYMAFVMFLEMRLISQHCINCYYFGKRCGFARGNLSAIFFKKGDQALFCKKEMTWKDMIPDLLIPLIPFVTGIILIIVEFRFIIFFAVVAILALTTIGNSFVRGNLTCKYCRQKEKGCPADALFNKK